MIIFAKAPLRGDPTFLFHAMERGIERASSMRNDIVGGALVVRRDSPTMHGVQALEDKQSQGSLQIVAFGSRHCPLFL